MTQTQMRRILNKYAERVLTGFILLEPVACYFEHGEEPLRSTRGGELLDKLSDYQRLKMISGMFNQLVSKLEGETIEIEKLE